MSVFEPAANFRRRASFGEEPRAMVRPEGKVRVLRWEVLVLWKGMVGCGGGCRAGSPWLIYNLDVNGPDLRTSINIWMWCSRECTNEAYSQHVDEKARAEALKLANFRAYLANSLSRDH